MFVCQKLDILNLYAIRTILAGFVESSYRTCFIGRIDDYVYFWICHIMTSIPLISCFLVNFMSDVIRTCDRCEYVTVIYLDNY